MEFAMGGTSNATGRLTCAFEISISNRSNGNTLQQVRIMPREVKQHQSFELRIQAQTGTDTANPIRPRQHALFRGELEVITPFEPCPHADVSYLLSDNLCCTTQLRLPLAITRLMSPCQPPT